jgi:hypothetical protein
MMTEYLKAEDSDKESDTEEAELTNPSPLDDKPTEPHQALAAFDYESDTSNDDGRANLQGHETEREDDEYMLCFTV